MKRRKSKAATWAIRIVVILLALLMVVLPILGDLIYAVSYDWEKAQESGIEVADGLQYRQGIYYYGSAGDRFTENYLTFSPGTDIHPYVTFGHDIYGAATLARAVSLLQEENLRTVAAVNGDFFTVATGVSIGMVVQNGILKTGSVPEYFVCAFDADGRATIGQCGLKITVSGDTMRSDLSSINFNKSSSIYTGVTLYDSNFGANNRISESAVHYVLDVVGGAMTVGGSVDTRVSSIVTGQQPISLAEGQMVLSFLTGSARPQELKAMQDVEEGDRITVAVEANDFLVGKSQVISGGDMLVENGKSVAPAGSTRAPRTAVGIRADGSALFYTVDGRQTGYSCGMTYRELAQRMIELGCVTALNLDGGGSTTVEINQPGQSGLTLMNQPSDGSLRSCGNYLCFVTTQQASGTATKLHLYPQTAYVLAGARLAYDVKATDATYAAVSLPGTVNYRVSGSGSVSGSTFTASRTAGKAIVTATAGGVSGTAEVTVVDRPDSVLICNETSGTEVFKVTLTAGQTYDFKGGAIAHLSELVADDRCFAWSCDETIGTIDADGVFTAGSEIGYGFVTAEVGGVSTDVMVTIVPSGTLLADFEAESVSGTGTHVTYRTNDTKNYVKFGSRSLQVTYDLQAGETAVLPLQYALTEGTSDLNFWMYGDRSGSTLSVLFNAAEGETVKEQAVEYGPVDFGGWKQIFVDVPANAVSLKGLALTGTADKTGTVYLDQLVISDGFYYDRTAPFAELTVEGRKLTAVLSDDKDGAIRKDWVTVTYDGKPVEFTYYQEAQSLMAMLPAADQYDHQVAVTVQDLSGNLFRAFISMPADALDETDTASLSSSVSTEAAVIPFNDTKGHWAESYANYLYQQKLSAGVETVSGLQYQPNAQMTRQEIAVMMARWMGVMGRYDDVQLPYADANQIASWALPAAKAMYALGIITGSEENGKVYFMPGSVLTRETIMTMLGRMQDCGYAESTMNFKDAAKVSEWAYPYVTSLVGQGIISGSDGYLRPSDPVTRGEAAKIICCLY